MGWGGCTPGRKEKGGTSRRARTAIIAVSASTELFTGSIVVRATLARLIPPPTHPCVSFCFHFILKGRTHRKCVNRASPPPHTHTHLSLALRRARRSSPPPRHRVPLPLRHPPAAAPVALAARRSRRSRRAPQQHHAPSPARHGITVPRPSRHAPASARSRRRRGARHVVGAAKDVRVGTEGLGPTLAPVRAHLSLIRLREQESKGIEG